MGAHLIRVVAGVAFGCLSSSLAGQEGITEVRIKLNSVDGGPINGALVALLTSKDSVVAEGLSSESGVRALAAQTGAYRIRVRRIGYLPFIFGPVSLPHPTELSLDIESPRVVLERIVVNSKSECRRGRGAQALSSVWDEIDKALRSSQLTTEDLAGIGIARRYRKETG